MKTNCLRISCCLFAIFLGLSALYSQSDTIMPSGTSVNWRVEAYGGGSTGDWAPYLIGSNSGGRHAMKSSAVAEGSVWRDFDLAKRFSWTAGIDLAAGFHASATYDLFNEAEQQWTTQRWHPSNATIYQLWAGLKFRGVMLWGGMKDRNSPVVDDALSSGDLLLSNNARAIPVVEIGFVDFQNIPFTKGWVQINGSIAYGKYTDSKALENRYNRWIEHITLSQLFTYKRIHFRSRPDRPLSVTVGVQAGGEFGGTTYFYDRGKLTGKVKNSQDLRSFWEMFIPTLRHADGFVEGNQLGTWDFKARYRTQSGFEVEGYFQWLWEDGSGMAKRNQSDGLWGLSFKLPGENKVLKKIIAEYIDFRDQSGPMHWAPGDFPGASITTEATGGDNYYNNSSFNAWSNYGLCIGSSFPKAPLYNSDGFPQFQHNRTHGFQIAATGNIVPTVDWTAKLSYAAAWGMGRIPQLETLKNTSMAVNACWKPINTNLEGFSASVTVAFDAGSLRGNNFGALLNLAYSGNFTLNKKH